MQTRTVLLVVAVLAGAACLVAGALSLLKPASEPAAEAAAPAFPRREGPPPVPAAAEKPEPAGESLKLVRPVPRPEGCVAKVPDGYEEPATLQALLACHDAARGRRPGDDAFDETLRAEVRDYLSRHPERATTESQ